MNKKFLFLPFLFLLILLISFNANADWETDKRITTHSLEEDREYSNVWSSKDSNNNIHLTWSVGSFYKGPIYYKVLNSVGEEIVAEQQVSSTNIAYSSIAVDSNDNVHIVYGGEGGEYTNLYYRRNSNGIWSSEQTLASSSFYPVIAIDSNNNLHVVWQAYEEPRAIYYIKANYNSATQSWTWGTPQKISHNTDTSDWAFQPTIAIQNFGSSTYVHVVWYRIYSNEEYWKLDYIRSEDCGNTWDNYDTTIAETTDSTNYFPGTQTTPGISVSGSYIHITFGMFTDIYYIMSSNYGDTWTSRLYIDTTSGFLPQESIASNSDGFVYIVWSKNNYIYYKESQNNGDSWSSNTLLINTKSRNPYIIRDNENDFQLLWSDYRNDNDGDEHEESEIYYKKNDIKLPAPKMNSEPLYTKGEENTVSWQSVNKATQYNVEVAEDINFTQNKKESGWISQTSYTFYNLKDGKKYYYRAKARNSTEESSFSAVVYSTQDSSPPIIQEIIVIPSSWSNNPIFTFYFTAIDNSSGIKNYYYVLNGTEESITKNTTKVKAYKEGINIISVKAEDNVGNICEYFIKNFYYDKTKPNATIKFDLFYYSNITYISSKTLISFEGNDSLSGIKKIYYIIENKTYEYNLPFNISGGLYNITYYSLDNAGNFGDRETIKVNVLNALPLGTFLKDEPEFTKGKTNTLYWESINYIIPLEYLVEVSIEENFSYILDSKFVFINSYTFINLIDGIKYYYRIRTRDIIGNENLTYTNIVNSTQDDSYPKLTIKIRGEKYIKDNIIFVKKDSIFNFSAIDLISGVEKIEYSLNNIWNIYNEFSISKNSNLKIKVIDKVGNYIIEDYTVFIDEKPPIVQINIIGEKYEEDIIYIGKNNIINFSGYDDSFVILIKYSINDYWKNYNENFSLEYGYYNISYIGIDILNNTAKANITIFVKDTKPIIKIFSPKNNENVYGFVKINGTIEEKLLKNVYIIINEEQYEIQKSNNFYYYWNTEKYKDGNYKITVRAIDIFGNEENTSINVKVENGLIEVSISLNNEIPNNLIEGDKVIISVNVNNSGNVAVEITIRFYIDNQLKKEERVNIKERTTKNIEFLWIAKRGKHNLRVVLDEDNNFKEFNENNNEILKEINVKGEHDLTILFVFLLITIIAIVGVVAFFVLKKKRKKLPPPPNQNKQQN